MRTPRKLIEAALEDVIGATLAGDGCDEADIPAKTRIVMSFVPQLANVKLLLDAADEAEHTPDGVSGSGDQTKPSSDADDNGAIK